MTPNAVDFARRSTRFVATIVPTLALLCGAMAACPGIAAAPQVIESHESAAWSKLQAGPLLDAGLTLRELRAYVTTRIPSAPAPKSVAEWTTQAEVIRTDVLDRIVFRGEAVQWRDATTCIEWLDTVSGGSDYVVRKFRYEALPGLWFPGLLYEPIQVTGQVPVFINVNGHDPLGKATPQTQLRCINLAKRGCLAYLLEFLNMGQLRHDGNRHNALLQLDLCGTSGIAPFYLCLTRGLDVALAHPQADATRVGVAGLSGGGWQTIMLASLDKRITLANPVAGYASLFTRAQYTRDIGDAEQIPSDLGTIADYTHLTALLAPRPLLLTYNAGDECCFLPEGSLPPLEEAARPIYKMFGAADRIRTHINYEPGTHNFESDNRDAFYRLVADFYYPGDAKFNRVDIPVPTSELKSTEELAVELPVGNATLHSLAVQISQSLPSQPETPNHPAADGGRPIARERLRKVVHLEQYTAQSKTMDSTDVEGVKVTRSQVSFNDAWTLPVVEFIPGEVRATAIVFGDKGRESLNPTAKRLIDTGHHVLVVDLAAFGETNNEVQPIEWQMIATSGGRLLGIQAGQLIALANLVHSREGHPKANVVAVGPRASVIAAVAAASEPMAFGSVELADSWVSIKTFIDENLELKDAPELGCFGLLREFDIPQLLNMIDPRPVDAFHEKRTEKASRNN